MDFLKATLYAKQLYDPHVHYLGGGVLIFLKLQTHSCFLDFVHAKRGGWLKDGNLRSNYGSQLYLLNYFKNEIASTQNEWFRWNDQMLWHVLVAPSQSFAFFTKTQLGFATQAINPLPTLSHLP